MICSGYGQTEATAAVTLSVPGDYFSGSVGTPACCCQIKLVDVEDQNYAASSDKGEVCVKGANVFKGNSYNPIYRGKTFKVWFNMNEVRPVENINLLNLAKDKFNSYQPS